MDEEAKYELLALGKTIRDSRKLAQRDLSQEKFAELCDLHRTYIGQVERGEKNISFVNILRIAKALEMPPSELFKRAGL